jgi:hypothetical protein
MIQCNKCKGRVFIDRVYSQRMHIELFCIMCGKRWVMNKVNSGLGRWIQQKEIEHQKSFGIFS